jgi:type IV secretory pathway VirJ component
MKLILSTVVMFFLFTGHGQNSLPLQYTGNSDTSKPLVVYLSGDGGMNSFTTSLVQSLNKKGYAILALDSKNYFWKKKDPLEFASAMSQSISKYLKSEKRSSFVVLGYSFGADVSPFLITRLPQNLHPKCKDLVLLSVSAHTDFEVKIMDMLGWGNKKEENVIAELNNVSLPVTLFFGKDETDFPANKLTIDKQVVVMEGGHHYDNDTDDLANRIISKIR